MEDAWFGRATAASSAWNCTLAGDHPCGVHSPFQASLRQCLRQERRGGPPAGSSPSNRSTVEGRTRDEQPDKGETQADCICRFRQQHSVPAQLQDKARGRRLALGAIQDGSLLLLDHRILEIERSSGTKAISSTPPDCHLAAAGCAKTGKIDGEALDRALLAYNGASSACARWSGY